MEMCAPNVAANIAARSAWPPGQNGAEPSAVFLAPRYFAGGALHGRSKQQHMGTGMLGNRRPEVPHKGPSIDISTTPQCCAGSWAGLPGLLQTRGLLGTYDLVLSAETIYSTESQQQLLDCMKQVVLIAVLEGVVRPKQNPPNPKWFFIGCLTDGSNVMQ